MYFARVLQLVGIFQNPCIDYEAVEDCDGDDRHWTRLEDLLKMNLSLDNKRS